MVPGILPDFEEGEALETARVYSAAGEPPWPRLDRIDLSVSVLPMAGSDWYGSASGEASPEVRGRVKRCRMIQDGRYAGRPCRTNGTVRAPFSELASLLSRDARGFLTRAADRLGLSGRSLGRVCRVARTIADLAGEKTVSLPHLAEAVQYRLPDFTAGEDGIRP